MTTRKTHRAAALLVGAMALTTSLAACTEAETQESAESAACAGLVALQAAADDVRALDSSSTVEEAEAAADELAAALEQLRADATDLQEADADALEAAADDIRQAIADIQPEQTLAESAADVADATPAMEEAVTEIRDGLSCS